MKKILGWLAVGIVCVVIVLCAILYAAVTVRGRTIAERKPLTLEELDRSAKKLRLRHELAFQQEFQEASPTEVTDTEAESSAKAEASLPLPRQLAGRPSFETLEKRFGLQGLSQDGIAKDAKYLKALEGMAQAVGIADGLTHQVGAMLLARGKWDDARRYLYQVLEETSYTVYYRTACAELAWLEEDPEKAVRLLELSIDEKNQHGLRVDLWTRTLQERLSNAVELCQATGSEALADFYREKMLLYKPEAESQFDSQDHVEVTCPG